MEGRAIVHMPRLAMSMKKIRHLEFCCQIRKHFRTVEKTYTRASLAQRRAVSPAIV